jgi:flagellar basal-body rod modification protein FlgD
MTISTVNNGGTTPPVAQPPGKSGMAALGQEDFLKLLTVQMQQQDPFDPVDNKEMLAQMAQFSSLAGIAELNDTLKAIAGKLDVVLAAQSSTETPAEEEPAGDVPAESSEIPPQE